MRECDGDGLGEWDLEGLGDGDRDGLGLLLVDGLGLLVWLGLGLGVGLEVALAVELDVVADELGLGEGDELPPMSRTADVTANEPPPHGALIGSAGAANAGAIAPLDARNDPAVTARTARPARMIPAPIAPPIATGQGPRSAYPIGESIIWLSVLQSAPLRSLP